VDVAGGFVSLAKSEVALELLIPLKDDLQARAGASMKMLLRRGLKPFSADEKFDPTLLLPNQPQIYRPLLPDVSASLTDLVPAPTNRAPVQEGRAGPRAEIDGADQDRRAGGRRR
jgi:hypothetical protein